MIRTILSVVVAAWCAAFLAAPVAAAEKQWVWGDQPQSCDVYGPGYQSVGGTCVKVGGSVQVDVTASSPSGDPSAASSSDWITTKPGGNGN